MDSFGSIRTLDLAGRRLRIAHLPSLERRGLDLTKLPFSLRILLENLLRREDGRIVCADDIEAVARWRPGSQPTERDRVHAGARAAAGLHRRAGGGRPRRHARRDGGARRRSRAHQPAAAGRAGDRSLGAGRRVRHGGRLPAQLGEGVRAQRGALRVPALGTERLPQLPGGAAVDRDRAPGEPRVPGARGDERRRRRRRRRALGLSRHAGGHRLAHHDDQRTRRPRLGRRRHRSRGRHARAADLDAGARGGGLPSHRCDAERHHRHRPGAHRDAAAARARRGRQVRRVPRPRPAVAVGGRPRHHRQHGARVRRHLRLLPGRRRDAPVPALDRPRLRPDRPDRGVHEGAGTVPRRVEPGRRVQLFGRARPGHRGAQPRRTAAAAGPGAAHRRAPLVRARARRDAARERRGAARRDRPALPSRRLLRPRSRSSAPAVPATRSRTGRS